MDHSASPGSTIPDDQIRRELAPFFDGLKDGHIDKIRTYLNLLVAWNRTISLTSLSAPGEILARHFGESIFSVSQLPVENCRLADVGTGAGFPGLPVKILRPDVHLTLIESNKKKCAFLAEVVRRTGLSSVEILSERYEQIRVGRSPYDVITARALGDFKELLRWSHASLRLSGRIMLWVGADDVSRIIRNKEWTWDPAIRIPESQRRFLLVGRPLKVHEGLAG